MVTLFMTDEEFRLGDSWKCEVKHSSSGHESLECVKHREGGIESRNSRIEIMGAGGVIFNPNTLLNSVSVSHSLKDKQIDIISEEI